MGVYTGHLGAINGVSNVRNWTIEETSDPKAAVSSATRRGTARKAGVKSWTGTFSQYGGNPSYMPGDTIAFVGYRNSTTDVRNTAGIRSFGDVIVDSVAITWNWNSNEIISMVTNFSGDGELQHGSGAGVIDATIADLKTPCSTDLMLEGAVLPDVLTATLTFTMANQAYASSSTYVSASGSCWTKRKRGGALDFTLAIAQYNEAGIAPIVIGADAIIKLYTNATEFWDLKWCQLQGISGVTIDIETGALIQQTLNFNFNGIKNAALGYIRKPGSLTDYWPSTP
jgi:hypothetical protein